MNKKENRIALLFILPSLIGFLIFYILPFVFSTKYALTDNAINGSFVGFLNFKTLFASEPFLLAVGNTIKFIAVSIPLNIVIPLFIACLLRTLTKNKWIGTIFMSPLVVPTACIAFFFQSLFSGNGLFSQVLHTNQNWIQTDHSFIIAVGIYVWKNMGYNLILMMAGLSDMPKDYYEWASVEGMGKIQFFFTITLTYLIPTLFIAFVMSFINSFKVFKEIYMLSGSYPNEKIYMLQHYMNNQFSSLNYQNLTAAPFVITAVITIVVILFFIIDKKTELGE